MRTELQKIYYLLFLSNFLFLFYSLLHAQNIKYFDKSVWNKNNEERKSQLAKINNNIIHGKNRYLVFRIANYDSYAGIDGHPGGVNSITINKAGTMIASSGNDGTIRLFDSQSGNNLHNYFGHSSGVSSIAFSPDGLKLASGSLDNSIKIWDINTGNILKTLTGHTEQVNAIAFSPDGAKLASGSGGFPDFFGENDYTVKLWDINAGTLIRSYSGHTCMIYSVAFSPDGTKIASSAGSEEFFFQIFDNSIKVWDVNSNALLKTLKGHTSDVVSVAFSLDGYKIISGSMDTKIKIWDAVSYSLIKTISAHNGSITSVVYSPDGKQFASCSSDTTIKLWESSTGAFIRTFKAHKKEVNSICFAPDGMNIYSGSNDNSIKTWQVNNGLLLNTILTRHNIKTSSIVFTPDSKIMVTAGEEREIRVWDVQSLSEIRTLRGHTGYIKCLAISADGKKLASGSDDNKIKIWNVTDSTELKSLSGHSGSINSIAISLDGTRLISGGSDSKVKIWDLISGNIINTLSDHKNYVYSVAYSPDGTKFASAGGSEDHAIRIWDANNYSLIGTLAGHALGTTFVVFSPDGKKIASIGYDETIKLWNLSDNSLSATLMGHNDFVNTIDYLKDGSILASAGNDGIINLWDLNKGNIIRKIAYDHGFSEYLKCSPDSQKIASVGWGYKNIRLYNLKVRPASIKLSDTALVFNAVQNERIPDPQIFKISNNGDLTLDWSISDDATWLDINPINGKDSGIVTISINSTGINPGNYTANITISASAADNNPKIIKIIYNVRPAYPSTLNLNRTIEFNSRQNISDYKPIDYKIIGIPGKGEISIKDFLTGTQGIDWQVFYDNGADTNFFKEYDGTSDFLFSTGRAFWILKRDALVINKRLNSAPLNSNYETEIILHKGWNLITNPFMDALAWSKIADINNIQDSIWKFNGNFEMSSSFDPFTGYYFDNRTNLSRLKIPYLNQVSGSCEKIIQKENIWRIGISLKNNSEVRGSIFFGVSKDAVNEIDKYDFRKPRICGDIPDIYFNRQNWEKGFSWMGCDIRPDFEKYQIWEFNIQNIENHSSLMFTGINSVPSRYKIYLFDFGAGKYYDLKSDSLFEVYSSAQLLKYSVIIGLEEYLKEKINLIIQPEVYSLTNYPNPFNSRTCINITLPYTAQVSLILYDLLGRKVKSIYSGFLSSGKHDFEWDGRDGGNRNCSSGIYLCHFRTDIGKNMIIRISLLR